MIQILFLFFFGKNNDLDSVLQFMLSFFGSFKDFDFFLVFSCMKLQHIRSSVFMVMGTIKGTKMLP